MGLAGEYYKVTEGLLWKGKSLPGNKQNLVGEFCVVATEFSNLRCLMNTLLEVIPAFSRTSLFWKYQVVQSKGYHQVKYNQPIGCHDI